MPRIRNSCAFANKCSTDEHHSDAVASPGFSTLFGPTVSGIKELTLPLLIRPLATDARQPDKGEPDVWLGCL